MKTILCFILTLSTFVIFTFLPSSFAQKTSPEYVVRVIYFHPNDHQPDPDIDATLDTLIKDVQKFYADEMEHHGFGRKTFRLETDAAGDIVVHRATGKFTEAHYAEDVSFKTEVEINDLIEISKNIIYLFCIDAGGNSVSRGSGNGFRGDARIFSDDFEKTLFAVIAHELGHTFGLNHDWRDDAYIMSYGAHPNELSQCAAEWLDASRYFNTNQTSFDQHSTIQMLPTSLVSPPNTIRLQFEVSDPDGLHQAQLISAEAGFIGCEKLKNDETIVEFITTQLTGKDNRITINVIDKHGNISKQKYSIPFASLTKLVDVDVEITTSPPPPQPTPEDSAETPEDGSTQPTETPAPSTITAGQITFSELMFATSGGLFSQPQWIELFNNGPVGSEPVNLRGSRLVIEARDSETRHRYSTIVLEDLHIKPKWTVLLVTRGNSRNSGYLSEDRVYNLYDHNNVSSLGLRENAVLPASGFALKLFAADGTLIDTAGNLDGVKRSKDTPMWELPLGWTEDRARTSLIRRYEEGTALPGTEAMSWVRAADVELSMELYYGQKTDIGTPGYRRGGPLPVTLSHFGANRTDAGIIIEWTTESETDNAGFNILRGQTKDSSFVKVNPTLIQGAGTTAERTNYTWTDMTAKSNVAYYYRIEDVSFSGDRQPLATVRMRGHISASDKLTTTWSELKVQD